MKRILKQFTPWVSWNERSELNLALPGVYILASFKKRVPRKDISLSRPLIYIGETCGQTLHGRLQQFARSAFKYKIGHSGGRTFHRKYALNREPEWLYISVLGVSKDEPHCSAYIRHVERAILWEYVCKHGKYPECNKK